MNKAEVFNPVLYSFEENQFLRDRVGQPPVVALRDVPVGVNRAAVRPVIEKIYELTELQKHSGLEWVGIEAIQQAIDTYIQQATKWQNDRRKGAPRFPSMFSYDTKGRPHRHGVGSDSEQVKTYFVGKERKPFAVELVPDGEPTWVPDWEADAPSKDSGLTVNAEAKRIECFCGHTEQFNADSRASFNAARARMSKHLRSSTDEVERHRETHTMEFS